MKKLVIFLFLLANLFCLSGQLTLSVKIPSSTPSGDIYIAGNFNSWNPKNENYKLKKVDNLLHEITLDVQSGKLEFKFTRGAWSNPEGTSQGGYLPNRIYNYDGAKKTIDLEVAGWEDVKDSPSTASPNVKIDDEKFPIKTLNRTRRIWVYLPPDYNITNKNYPVIYMHDGQNLFDKKTSFSDEWQVDETLDKLFNQGVTVPIVVGIDNGGANRLNEYSPWKNNTYGGGEGDQYLDFIINELKPYIDNKYRTKTTAENTAIIGSSMGGLISMYAAQKHPEVFGKIGPLSSSYWFSPQSYVYAESKKYENVNQKIYMIAGGQEGGNQVGDMNKMKDILLKNDFDKNKIVAVDHPSQGHNEKYWATQFETIYKWLFAETSSTSTTPIYDYDFKQDSNRIYYFGEDCNSCEIIIYNLQGQLLQKDKWAKDWNVDKTTYGAYAIFSLVRDGKVVLSREY